MGAVTVAVAEAEYSVPKFAGSINCVPAIATMFAYSGWAYVNTTVSPETVAGLANAGRPATFAAGVVLTRLNVAATSAGPNDDPSLNFTPVRMVNVSVLPP